MRLRFAAPADAETLLEIYRPYVEETTITFETAVPSPAEFRARIRDISAQYPYLVLEEDGVILGYAYAHAFHERAAFHWTAETTVYVRRDLRGKHLGATLYRSLLELLAAQGVETACALVTVPNAPSICFHQAMGFSLEGSLPHMGYKLERWCGLAYLCRRLPQPEGQPPVFRPVWELEPGLVEKIFGNALGNA